MLKEVSEASASMREEVNRLQTQPSYRRRGERRTLSETTSSRSRSSEAFYHFDTVCQRLPLSTYPEDLN